MSSSSKTKRKRGSGSKSPVRLSLLVNVPHEKVAISVDKKIAEGCLVCGKDNDHSFLLICELCNAEYHTYCLNPPLQGVPDGDWFCGKYHRYIREKAVLCTHDIFLPPNTQNSLLILTRQMQASQNASFHDQQQR